MASKKKQEISIRSSAAEYLTYTAAVGDQPDSIELRYEDENIWPTQKLMAELYGVSLPTINEHLKKVYSDKELTEGEAIRKFRIVNAKETGRFPARSTTTASTVNIGESI